MAKVDFLVGADPEFGFLDHEGNGVHAADVVSDNDDYTQEFGLDGGHEVAEIRPKPASEPVVVVANIRKAMHEGIRANEDASDYAWKAGSAVGGAPTGGHIHFGVRGMLRGLTVAGVCEALDRYLAYPLMLLEDPEEASRRRDGGRYGALTDFRNQPWGIEYRTLGSWITSPYIAAGVLCLAKAVMWEAVHNGLASHKPFEVMADEFQEAELASLRLHQDGTSLWKDIRKFELYQKYKQPIELLHTLIGKHKTWFPSCGMRAAWAVDKTGKIPKETSLKEIWSKA